MEKGISVKTILCPTRGGEASIPNQLKAVELAQERGANLIFLYVSNVHFLDHTAAPVTEIDIVEEQLDEVGEFLLTMAVERAREAGLEAECVVRRGVFRQAVIDVINSNPVELVVIGSADEDTAWTTPEYRQSLAQFLTEDCEVEFIVTSDGEIAEHHYPPEKS